MLSLLGWAGRQARRWGFARPESDCERRVMYQPQQARLFIKPYCGWCTQAMDWLDDHGIRYDVLDVIADRAAYDEMVRLSGQSLAPVIQVDGHVLGDFGARELAAFWKTLGQRHPAP